MAKMIRPKTVREMQADQKKREKSGEITISNCSKQLVPIHLNAPKGVDFYVGAQDYRLYPGKMFTFKKDRLRMQQVERLQKQGMIQIIFDSDKQLVPQEI